MKARSSATQQEGVLREKGSIMVVILAALLGLLVLAGVTILTVHHGTRSSTEDYNHSQAMYAAESGIAVGMDFLRANHHPVTHFGALVSPSNATPVSPASIDGNGDLPGSLGNLFGPGTELWYEVTILNNQDDLDFAIGADQDSLVVLRSVGHAAGNAQVTLEVELQKGVPLALITTSWREVR